MPEIEVTLGNGQSVKAKVYGVAITIEEVEAPAISITFDGAQTVIGVETLESIGLKLDPTTGKLEFTRPKGMAYFYKVIGLKTVRQSTTDNDRWANNTPERCPLKTAT
jgi:hypothetical protein